RQDREEARTCATPRDRGPTEDEHCATDQDKNRCERLPIDLWCRDLHGHTRPDLGERGDHRSASGDASWGWWWQLPSGTRQLWSSTWAIRASTDGWMRSSTGLGYTPRKTMSPMSGAITSPSVSLI